MTEQERCDEYFAKTLENKEYAGVKQKVMKIMPENSLMNFFRLLWALDALNKGAIIRSLHMVIFEKEQSYLSMWDTETEEMHALMREMVELVEGWFCEIGSEEESCGITWSFIPL